MMGIVFPSIVNIVVASTCLALGAIVLVRNLRRPTHQTFALLTLNLSLWAIGVLGVIHSETMESARAWVHFSELVTSLLPATLYHFIGYFPKGRFDGSTKILALLYGLAAVLATNTLRPGYLQEITLVPGELPRVQHHGSIALMSVFALFSLVIVHGNLRRKYKDAQGFGRRQIQFVMTGAYTTTAFCIGLVLTEFLFQRQFLQPYGPAGILLLIIPFAYAMVRYHLLDTRAFMSRLAVYLASTGFVIFTIVAIDNIAQLLFPDMNRFAFGFTVVFSSIIIALIFRTVHGSVEHLIEVVLLRQRYDVDKLYRRIAEQAGESANLDVLLSSVAGDIERTVGVDIIRVLLIDRDDPGMLTTEFTTIEGEKRIHTREHRVLLDYFSQHPKPLILEKILHRRLDERMIVIARHLADLDAYFCMPLHTNKGLVGILTLGQKHTQDIYSEEELLAFSALSGPLATAITNAWLYRELERVHRHQSDVFEQMREGVIAVNTKGVITLANTAATSMAGQADVGASMEELHPEVAELLQRTLELNAPVQDFETTLQVAEAEPVSVIMSSSCLRTSEGATEGALALIYDLSQIKRLEENVQRADRLSSIGTLAAGMAHEIKNPLVSIKTFTQLLLERYTDPDFRETFQDVVPHEVDRIDTIVSRLLDFARPKPVEFEPQNVRTIVEEVLALVDNETRRNSIDVQVLSPDEDILVYGDDQQLHQVFLNLVMNAIDAMENQASGALTIEISQGYMAPSEGKAESVFDTLPSVVITLADSGCGIPQGSLQDLFTPFFTTKDDGCGLGLAVVHGIITEHGGTIDVSSTLNEGTTMRISLPKTERAAVEKSVREIAS